MKTFREYCKQAESFWCERETREQITAVGIHWEGEPITCDGCYEEIESAYGDPDEGEGF